MALEVLERRTNDPDLVTPICEGYHKHSILAGNAQRKVSIFVVVMIWVVDRGSQSIGDYGTRFLKCHSMLALVRQRLVGVPFERQTHCTLRGSKELALLPQVPGGRLEVLAAAGFYGFGRLVLLTAEVFEVGLAIAAADDVEVEVDVGGMLFVERA